jgi:hypothetical protein
MKWRSDGTNDGAGSVSPSHVHHNTEFAFCVWSPRFELMRENLNRTAVRLTRATRGFWTGSPGIKLVLVLAYGQTRGPSVHDSPKMAPQCRLTGSSSCSLMKASAISRVGATPSLLPLAA